MTDDIIKPVLFYFCCATVDVFFTTVVLFTGIGIEGNPIWNWITPPELMLVCCVLANLIVCLVVMYGVRHIPHRFAFYKTFIKFGLYGEGLGRVVFGAVPGILLMKNAGWF